LPERPLLILPSPGQPAGRHRRTGGGGPPHLPGRERQVVRLGPRFTVLEQALEARRARLQAEALGLVPEEVIVLETVGTIDDFIVGVRNVPGLEWLGEIEAEDIPPDDDFFETDREGEPRRDKPLHGRLFLVLTNQQALRQMLSLWQLWSEGHALPYGLRKWRLLFSQLRDVRQWGVRDRLMETGVLEDWRERVEHQEAVPCEVELWFRQDPRRRQAARDRVRHLVEEVGGRLLNEGTIEEIAYHGLLAQLPADTVRRFVGGAGQEIALVQCEQIQYFRATGQMVGIIHEDDRMIDEGRVEELIRPLREPIIALFDGLPLQNHRRLARRLVVDDPDNIEAQYQASERRHGTAMASLILHGDLGANEPPLQRLLYVRPILQPDSRDWRQPRDETVPDGMLLVDLIHRAVRRLFVGEGEQPPTGPQICVINLSIGIRDRLFESAMSPLARLLDWLSWKYRVLFIVSAGNHPRGIELAIPRGQLQTLGPDDLQRQILRAIASDARHRRLVSPAEAINVITLGAVHHDFSRAVVGPPAIEPFVGTSLPSPINAQGMGYRRTIKPEILLSGGRVALFESLQPSATVLLELSSQSRPPGQIVAAPGQTPGDLGYAWYTRGTSNAAALASHTAALVYDVLDELRTGPGGELLDAVPRAVWLKAALVHASSWGPAGSVLEQALKTRDNAKKFKEYLTRLIGYGVADATRVLECTPHRVTALSGGLLHQDQAHTHRFPLPPSLSGLRGLRRLIITLAWLTPVNPLHQAWRRADLWFTPPLALLQVERREADWQAAQRGTVQHEVLEGDRAAVFVADENIEIRVNCRPHAGALEDPVPYALAVTLEVAQEIGIDIYEEVRVRIHAARIAVTPRTG
jgi:hypothetical protein